MCGRGRDNKYLTWKNTLYMWYGSYMSYMYMVNSQQHILAELWYFTSMKIVEIRPLEMIPPMEATAFFVTSQVAQAPGLQVLKVWSKGLCFDSFGVYPAGCWRPHEPRGICKKWCFCLAMRKSLVCYQQCVVACCDFRPPYEYMVRRRCSFKECPHVSVTRCSTFNTVKT